jgi:hypothetical protein
MIEIFEEIVNATPASEFSIGWVVGNAVTPFSGNGRHYCHNICSLQREDGKL